MSPRILSHPSHVYFSLLNVIVYFILFHRFCHQRDISVVLAAPVTNELCHVIFLSTCQRSKAGFVHARM